MKGLIYMGVPKSRFVPETKSHVDRLFTGGPEGPESPEEKTVKVGTCRGEGVPVESSDVREAFEERAAIIEFEAGLPREEAERLARRWTHYLGW